VAPAIQAVAWQRAVLHVIGDIVTVLYCRQERAFSQYDRKAMRQRRNLHSLAAIVAAQRLRPNLRVLFTTGYARNALVHHGRLDPGIDLISKPFTTAALAVKIRELLDKP
jgi:hypothetical protein